MSDTPPPIRGTITSSAAAMNRYREKRAELDAKVRAGEMLPADAAAELSRFKGDMFARAREYGAED